MRLLDVQVGAFVLVLGFKGQKTSTRLLQLGVFPGDRVRVLRAAPLHGPLLIQIGPREVAVGRSVAARIEVEPA